MAWLRERGTQWCLVSPEYNRLCQLLWVISNESGFITVGSPVTTSLFRESLTEKIFLKSG